MKKLILLSVLLMSGCISYDYSSYRGTRGYGGIPFEQAEAECEFQASLAADAGYSHSGNPLLYGYDLSVMKKRCLVSKGFR